MSIAMVLETLYNTDQKESDDLILATEKIDDQFIDARRATDVDLHLIARLNIARKNIYLK